MEYNLLTTITIVEMVAKGLVLTTPYRLSAMAESSGAASCPICNKPVPLEAMNNHIDICLLPGGKELHGEQLGDESRLPSSTSLATNPSQSFSAPVYTSQLQPVQSSLLRKRSSPSTSPSSSSSSSSKQSFLSFGQTSQPHLSTGTTTPAKPPPAKVRKLARSSSVVTATDTDNYERMVNAASSPAGCEGHDSKKKTSNELSAPLADIMRPHTIDDYVGQENVIGKNAILRTILESGNVPSLIFWGPPGCGKTTLARIIAKVAHQKLSTKFVQLSATTAGVKDIKEIVQVARNEKILLKRNTILFIDEIHRFNKLQQDTFLPHVEDGTITLLGATTENPSFQLNSALLSRCRVIVLEKLESEDIEQLLKRALEKLGALVKGEEEREQADSQLRTVFVEPDALTTLSQLCDGDARSALNGLELAVQAKRTKLSKSYPTQQANSNTDTSQETRQSEVSKHPSSLQKSFTTLNQLQLPEGSSILHTSPATTVTVQDVMDSLQRTHLLYDRAGEEHYNIISALHKSMRGSDANASLYWLARMLCAGEDPLYVARRVVRFASEDIGLADPNALSQAVAAFQACRQIGMPECQVILAQAVVYMARAPKSVEVYMAYEKARQCILNHKGPLPSVPLHLRNAPTKLMKSLGYGKGYKYNPAFGKPVEQQYMPDGLEGLNFFTE